MFRLDDRIVLVTGAGSGIGAAIAHACAAVGAFVYVTDCNAEGGMAILEKLTADGGRGEFVSLDVRDEAACERVAGQVHDRWQRLDVLVNNAGIGHVGDLLHTTGADLDRLYAVNVRGVFNVTRAFLPRMIARRSGNIINLASIGAVVGVRERVAYCTTKFAVAGLTRSMALDHARDGIRVNCICPGRVETPFVAARLREYPDPAKARAEMEASQALGRMARPDEIASAAVYLASDESSFITGTEFIIDGGWSAGK
jgi:NAD(P)-dependent dehydrogenase (short-subunit alcohol dehydrogenase family)